MHFNAKKISNLDSFPASLNINRLIAIDTISVDDHSRLTLTRKIKKVLPILPNDTITVYQDRYNKDLFFAIQHAASNTTDSFIIKTRSSNSSSNAFYDSKIVQSRQQEKITVNHEIIKKRDTLRDVNIVIVDDQEDLLKVYEYFLKSEGYYNIHTFSDPKKVIKHFAQLRDTNYYDLAVIDIRMPIINGIQLYQILGIISPNMKMLFVTALDASSELTSLYKIKEEDIIKKPFELKPFINKINDAVLKIFESNKEKKV